ncbi:hypothetical protein B6U80_00985 [Candidatus Pacearchaeota archaeon ex4484_26]|nr:MAG: hypothetical protein B6U80_00985 [Candidatus Pacearchaeota archaeon ex4484_26]
MAFSFISIIIALVILILGVTLGSLVGKFVKRAIVVLELKKYFKFQIDLIASRLAAWLIYIFSIILALINLGIATPILYAIIILLLILISGVVFFMLKDFIPNVVAGAALQRRNLRKGLIIKSKDVSGKIQEITLTETKISSGKDIIYVPNSLLWKNILYVKKQKHKT